LKDVEQLAGKKILIGVSGSIAAYKTAGLVSSLVKLGIEVRVVMTKKATELVGPQTFQALSGHVVLTDDQEKLADHAMDHIEAARWADLMLISPCSANTLASLALGLGQNLLGTLYLAYEGKVGIAPAMNPAMWSKASVQRNVTQLIEDGCFVLAPAIGKTACGEEGTGRLPEEEEILAFIEELLS